MKHPFACAALGAALLATPAAAGGYVFVDLGTLGGANSAALGLNDRGQVVGWAEVPGCTTGNGLPCRRAFLWEDGVMTDLGFLAGDEGSVARAINDAGLIVGTSERDVLFGSGTYHAVTWTGGALAPLPDLGQGTSWANDVSELGLVAGYATDPGPVRDRAVTWSGGAITNVGSAEPHSYNRARGVNDLGALAGFAWDLFQPNDSIVFDGGAWTTIGGTDGPFQNSEAYDVNDGGTVVGLQAFPSGNWHAAYWPAGGHAVDLGVLPGMDLAELFDVNEAGLAVGHSFTDVTSRAVLSDGVQLLDLNTLLPAGTAALLLDATEINERGDIVGSALVGGVQHAYLLLDTSNAGNYCHATPNSTGAVATMSMSGTTSLANNDLVVHASGLPNQPCLFFYGPGQGELPFGNGVQCVVGGLTRLGPPQVAAGNAVARAFDVVGAGLAPGRVNVQCWFRDPAAGGAAFNTSDALELVLVP
ncbi:MAG: hypothetical protein H6828_06565 [Planctomycetes bacterium]|nr:hypothetical protein [Planctomycetota bacterium]